jgi:hypothetical protein
MSPRGSVGVLTFSTHVLGISFFKKNNNVTTICHINHFLYGRELSLANAFFMAQDSLIKVMGTMYYFTFAMKLVSLNVASKSTKALWHVLNLSYWSIICAKFLSFLHYIIVMRRGETSGIFMSRSIRNCLMSLYCSYMPPSLFVDAYISF